MNRGFLLLTIIFLGCDPTYDVHHFPQDTEAPVVDTDPECFGGDACQSNTTAECWDGIGDDPKEWLRITMPFCVCYKGVLTQAVQDKFCINGCTVNPIGQDYCIEEAE